MQEISTVVCVLLAVVISFLGLVSHKLAPAVSLMEVGSFIYLLIYLLFILSCSNYHGH
jgi:hypothetical protein